MTKEDIIKGLEQLLATSAEEILLTDDETEVVRSAISALSENKTQMIDKSSFDTEQYKADLQSAYDCGYNKALSENKGDLISRQAVLDELEKWDWQELYLPIHFKQILDDVPSVENKGEFDGMTNEEVMNHVLRKTFPRIIFIRGVNEYNKTKSIVYSEEWENAPYQKGE